MGKSSPEAPPAPDYAAAANATAAGNLDAARYATTANRVNSYTPYGSLTYSQDANNPDKWSQNLNLTSAGQSLLDQQNRTSQGLANLQDSATARVGSSLNSAIPGAYNPQGSAQAYNANGVQQPGTYDPNQATNNAADLINARLLPQQQRDQAALDNQLANQGITAGSEAYKNAQDQMGRTQNDARQQAQLQGITLGQSQQAQTYGQQSQNNQQGMAQQAQMYGQQFQNINQGMNQQQQQYQQQMANRNLPLNELGAIRTGSQVTNPTFQNAPQQQTTSGPDMMAAANGQNQYNMGLYNSQVGQQNAMMGMLGQLGGAALMM